MVWFCTYLLACVCPTLAFVSINAHWFTTKQILCSLGLAIGLGCFCGAFCHLIPDFLKGAIASLLFITLGECFYSSLFSQKTSKKIPIAIACMVVATLFGLMHPAILLVLLLIYTLCSFRDLAHNYNKPKRNVLSAKSMRRSTDRTAYTSEYTIPNPRNIYILFLESMHSSDALRALYDISGEDMDTYLKKRGFTVYPNHFGNASDTLHALYGILQMNQDEIREGECPQVFQILRSNGYEINILDVGIFTFRNLVQYTAYFNYDIPAWIAWIYEYFLPFFMQSHFLLYLTHNIDPFDSSAQYEGVRRGFFYRKPWAQKKPQCTIMRFGAQHVDARHRCMSSRGTWKKEYAGYYTRACAECKDMVENITSRDPKAIVVCVGDHGANSFFDCFKYTSDCEKTFQEMACDADILAKMQVAKLTREMIVQDAAGVLMAVRLPEEKSAPAISHTGLFPVLFAAMGGEDLAQATPKTYLYPPYTQRSLLIAENGKAVAKFVFETPYTQLEKKISEGQRCFSAKDMQLLAESFAHTGNVAQANEVFETAHAKFRQNTDLALSYAHFLLNQVRLQKCTDILRETYAETSDIRLLPVLREHV